MYLGLMLILIMVVGSNLIINGTRVVGVVVVLIILCAFIFVILKASIKKLYKSDLARQKEKTYTIKPDGLDLKTEEPKSFTEYKWSDLYAFWEIDKSFLVYISHTQCLIIPKKCFENDDRKIELARNYFSNLPLYKDKNAARSKFLAIYMIFLIMLSMLFIYFSIIK